MITHIQLKANVSVKIQNVRVELEGTVCEWVCRLKISLRAKEAEERKERGDATTITQGECDNNNQTSLIINQICT